MNAPEKEESATVQQVSPGLKSSVGTRSSDVEFKVGHDGQDPDGIPVRELMSDRVLYVRPEQLIEECMALMIDKHVRHLPVIDDGRLVGIVSMRDVVADVIAEKSFIIEQLENYIYEIPPHSRA